MLYHMSDTLKLGDEMSLDYKRQLELAEPFTQALAYSRDCFWAMYLQGKYLRAVLRKFKMREWSNYVKWSMEGVFEYVRRTEFPDCCCRLKANYFFDNLESARTLYQLDWGQASQEERDAIRLFLVELDDPDPARYDMRLFDEAFDGLWETDAPEDALLTKALDCARRYFSGKQSPEPVLEILSEKPARAVRDVTELLNTPT